MERGSKALYPPRFFRVEILVRLQQKFFDSLSIAAIDGNADTGGECGLFAVIGEDFPDTAGNTPRFVLLGFRENEGKFVAAIPRGSINGAAVKAENIGEPAEGAAADEMAVAVVDGFQAIKIEKQDRERPAAAIGALRFVFEDVEEATVIGKAGEWVAYSKVVDLFKEPGVIQQRHLARRYN